GATRSPPATAASSPSAMPPSTARPVGRRSIRPSWPSPPRVEQRPRGPSGPHDLHLQLQRLRLQVLLEAEAAEFPAVARLLVTAEGGEGVEAGAVEVDLARPQLPGHLLGALRVARPDPAGEAVDGAVGDGDGLLLGV